MPTIKDVAKAAGVSIATVSYVLNGKTSMVSEDTFQYVQEIAKQIGYVPNVTARNLKSSQSRLIGYAWHAPPTDMVNSVLDLFMYHLAMTAEESAYHMLAFTYPEADPLPVYEDLIRTGRVDGFIIAGTSQNDPRIRYLMDCNFPFVSFGRSDPDWDFPWVDTDGKRGIYDAVQYLLKLGHRRIAMVAWPEESMSGHFRVEGYLQALEEAGIAFRPDYLIRGAHSEAAGRAALDILCSLPEKERPTAIVSVSDLAAIGIMNQAEKWGLVVGKTLSVIGFDDAPVAGFFRPSLTTLRQPIPEISRALIQMLNTILSHKPLKKRHLLMAPQLVIRESCAEPSR